VASIWGLELEPGRHRRQDATVVVRLFFADGTDMVLAADAALARSMAQVATLLREGV
jgi:hypothetical protein